MKILEIYKDVDYLELYETTLKELEYKCEEEI
jgi:hypothetical protein